MPKENKQSQNEIRVFKEFAKVCPYNIDLESIEKRDPPEPDILCEIKGEKVAFEMVECIDSDLASSIYDSCKLGKVYHDELESLPRDRRERIKTKFRDVFITVVFNKGITFRKKTQTVKSIFDLLWTEEYEKEVRKARNGFNFDYTWQLDIKLNRELKKVLKRVTFNFPGFDGGPSIDITEPVWFTDPVAKQIQKKLRKKYRTEFKAELLVYYELQPEFPVEYWIAPELDTVGDRLKGSIFQKFWLFSMTQKKIMADC